jgi:hypothetical protein
MTMKPVAIIAQLSLPFREERAIDGILGKKRKSVNEGPIDFSQCPLAKAYPTIPDLLHEIYESRMAQKAGGPLMHPAARPPTRNVQVDRILKREAPPWEDGPSAHDVHKAYVTKQ